MKAGRIVDRTAEPGDTAQPGKPILTLYDSQSLRLDTPVLEQLAVKLQDLLHEVNAFRKFYRSAEAQKLISN